MLVAALFAALLVILWAPDSLPGTCLRRVLVEWPAARLSRLRTGDVIFGCGMLGLGILCLFVLQGDAGILFGLMSPEIAVWFTSFEMSLYLDAIVALGLVSGHARLRMALHGVRAGLAFARRLIAGSSAGPVAAPRQRRTRSAIARKAANDDAGGAGWPVPGWAPAMAA
jgi:hypothetical protein